jgi:hypothetical protein
VNKIIFFFLLLFVFNVSFVNAKTLSLHCKGKTEGSDIKTSYDPIDINVDVPSGQIYGFPMYKANGCSSTPKNFKIESNVTEKQFETKCINAYSSSTIRLNRYSGSLSIITWFNKDNVNWTSQYMCTEQKKKF